MKTPLTEEQLAEARKALQLAAEQEDQALTDQIVFEAKRDEIAYGIIRKAKQEKLPPISFSDAQKAAAELLKAAPAETAETPAQGEAIDIAAETVSTTETPPAAPADVPPAEEPPASGRRKGSSKN